MKKQLLAAACGLFITVGAANAQIVVDVYKRQQVRGPGYQCILFHICKEKYSLLPSSTISLPKGDGVMAASLQSRRFEEFQRHLSESAHEVNSWPDWMRSGARASMGLSQVRARTCAVSHDLPEGTQASEKANHTPVQLKLPSGGSS